jgi:hypothetical protein
MQWKEVRAQIPGRPKEIQRKYTDARCETSASCFRWMKNGSALKNRIDIGYTTVVNLWQVLDDENSYNQNRCHHHRWEKIQDVN